MARCEQPVAVVGGGPAGAIAAITLARLGMRVRVFERDTRPRRKPGEALTAGVLPLLRALSLSDLLDRPCHARGGHAVSNWWGAPQQLPQHFGLVDRAAFEAELAAYAETLGVEWHRGSRVLNLRRDGAHWRLMVEASGSIAEFAANRIIDASGRVSWVTRRLAGARLHHAKRTIAAWAELPAVAAPADLGVGSMLVHRAGEAWWYAARLPHRLSVMAVAARPPCTAVAFAARGIEAGAIVPLPPGCLTAPMLHPAHEAFAEAAYGDGWIAAGDAVASFDPIAGYGLTFAIGTGYYAARALADELCGAVSALETYGELVAKRINRVSSGVRALHAAASIDIQTVRQRQR